MSQESDRNMAILLEVFNASPAALLVVDDDVRTLYFNKTLPRCCCEAATASACCANAVATSCIVCTPEPTPRAAAGTWPTATAWCAVPWAEGAPCRASRASIRSTSLVTASPSNYDGQRLVLLALEDISELLALRSLLPICANCKKIRDDQNYWQYVESYFPQCASKLYP